MELVKKAKFHKHRIHLNLATCVLEEAGDLLWYWVAKLYRLKRYEQQKIFALLCNEEQNFRNTLATGTTKQLKTYVSEIENCSIGEFFAEVVTCLKTEGFELQFDFKVLLETNKNKIKKRYEEKKERTL